MADEGKNVVGYAPPTVALWGAGGVYRTYKDRLLDMQRRGRVRIVALADSSPHLAPYIDGIPVVRPSELAAVHADYVLVLNKRNAAEILRQAVDECGLSSEQLLPYGILRLKGFDFARYHRLRGSGLNIVSNGSWGASTMRFLGLEHRFPLAGVCFRENDYLRFLEGFDDYLAVDDLAFIDSRVDAYGRAYLAGRIGDIPVRFFAPHTPETAATMWERARHELRAETTVVQMHTLDRICERRFDSLTGFARKICLVPYLTDVPSSVQVPLAHGHTVYTISVEEMFGRDFDTIPIDMISILLGCDSMAC